MKTLPIETEKDPAKQPGKKDINDFLGDKGVKSANPKVNPLDKKDDDFLKDLK